MNWNRIGRMLILAVGAVSFLAACGLGSVPFVAQVQPSATLRPTRAPRATFTPRPAATDTLVPTDAPTDTPAPTDAPTQPPPTKKPTARPVAARPTSPPAPPQPTPIPATAAPQYPYKASIVTCQHAGNAYIKGSVCSDRQCNSKLSGMKVVMSDSPFGTPLDRVQTDASGEFTFVRNGSGPVANETWYIWVVNNQDQPLSDAGGPVPLNMGNAADDMINKCPNTAAFISFYKP